MKTFVRSLVAVCAVGMALMTYGCAGTKAAYQAAQSPEDYAYVVTEHYAAVVHELAAAKQSGKLTGDALTKVQAADNKVYPFVVKLRALAEAYAKTKSATDSTALQAAIDQAVPLLADLVKLMKSAGVSSTKLDRVEFDMWAYQNPHVDLRTPQVLTR